MLWYYLGASFVTSLFIGAIWYLAKKAAFEIRNDNRRHEEKPEIAMDKSIWSTISTDTAIPFMNCVLAIYKNGKLLRAGMAHNVTLNPETDPWIILKFTDLVEAELSVKAEKRTLLDQPSFSFTNIESGVTIDLYDGQELGKYVDDWYASISSADSCAE